MKTREWARKWKVLIKQRKQKLKKRWVSDTIFYSQNICANIDFWECPSLTFTVTLIRVNEIISSSLVVVVDVGFTPELLLLSLFRQSALHQMTILKLFHATVFCLFSLKPRHCLALFLFVDRRRFSGGTERETSQRNIVFFFYCRSQIAVKLDFVIGRSLQRFYFTFFFAIVKLSD